MLGLGVESDGDARRDVELEDGGISVCRLLI